MVETWLSLKLPQYFLSSSLQFTIGRKSPNTCCWFRWFNWYNENHLTRPPSARTSAANCKLSLLIHKQSYLGFRISIGHDRTECESNTSTKCVLMWVFPGGLGLVPYSLHQRFYTSPVHLEALVIGKWGCCIRMIYLHLAIWVYLWKLSYRNYLLKGTLPLVHSVGNGILIM